MHGRRGCAAKSLASPFEQQYQRLAGAAVGGTWPQGCVGDEAIAATMMDMVYQVGRCKRSDLQGSLMYFPRAFKLAVLSFLAK